jgi:hypothetical protein
VGRQEGAVQGRIGRLQRRPTLNGEGGQLPGFDDIDLHETLPPLDWPKAD